MYGLNVKHRSLGRNASLCADLTLQLLSHRNSGKMVIVTDRPVSLLSGVRKQWLKKMRRLQIDRSRTLNIDRIKKIIEQVTFMQNCSFTAKSPTDLLEADITFATYQDLLQAPPDCKALYITLDLPKEAQHMLTAWMPRNSEVVLYEQR